MSISPDIGSADSPPPPPRKHYDGGPAFPITHANVTYATGMTLRDYFAASALSGFLASFAGLDVVTPSPENAAKRAYAYADAMLKAREE